MPILIDPLREARTLAGRELDAAATMLCERIADVSKQQGASSDDLLVAIAKYVVSRNRGQLFGAFEHLVGVLRMLQAGGQTFPDIFVQLKTAAAYISELPEDKPRPLPARW